MTLLYFLLAISVLVVIHEYGHFWVARRCGVYVKRFSVGFGKPLWSFKDKYGTEYAIAPIPMGGYVSMLDEREGEVPPERLHQAFNRKSPWQRIAIAAAGPLANFLFAIAAYWFIFASGTTGLAPVIGEVKADSPAALAGIYAGDEIIAIAGKPINTWEDVNWRLVGFIGETADIAMSLQSEDGSQHQVTVQVNAWLANSDEPNPIAELGLLPRRLTIPAVLGEVLPDGAAWRAGLEKGDKILQVNDETVDDWFQWVEVVKNAPDQELQLQLERNGELLSLKLTPAARPDAQGKLAGFVGASVEIPQYPADWLRVRQLGV
ncbi:MAG: RIP metalloprotease RseP, partial [Venatoribacter sp.]